jgi:hypothetical protein
MSELRTLLERVGERVTPRGDAFERLGRLRQRRARNRRIQAGALALVVAAGGAVGVLKAFQHPGGPAPIVGTQPSAGGTQLPAEFHALWPERTLTDAQRAQGLVDNGQDRWRLQAAQVAFEFATDMLAWKDPVPESGGCFGSRCPFDDDTQAFTVHRGCLTCTGVVVEVQRLVRPGDTGIWSVTRVGGHGISLPAEPGATLESGSTIAAPTSYPDSAGILAGYAYLGECSGFSAFPPVRVSDGQIEFVVAPSSFREHCESPGAGGGSSASGSASAGGGPGLLARPVDGYVFVARIPGGATDLDPFSLAPGETVGIEDLAAVPVHFVPAASPAPSSPSPEPGVLPRGAFQWCPDVAGSLPPDRGASTEATDVAVKFAAAYAAGEDAAARSLADDGAFDHASWSVAGATTAIRPTSDSSAAGDGLVIYGCGPDVAEQSWEVTLDDGTSSASLDFTLYLIRRPDGWKVWGSY